MPNERPISVILSERFRKDVKQLLKKYRHVREDIQVLIDELESGVIPGDQISGAAFPIYKVSVKSTDILRGKSGGYRVIYYLRTTARIYLVTLYAKNEQSIISPETINRIIQELGLPSDE